MPSFNPSAMREKKGFEPLPPGEYQVEIKEAKHYDASGHDMLNMTCEVVEPTDHLHKRVFLSLFYNDFRTAELIEIVSGKTLEEFSSGKAFDDKKVFELLTDEFVKFRLGVKEYNGKKRNEIIEVINEKKKDKQAPLDI